MKQWKNPKYHHHHIEYYHEPDRQLSSRELRHFASLKAGEEEPSLTQLCNDDPASANFDSPRTSPTYTSLRDIIARQPPPIFHSPQLRSAPTRIMSLGEAAVDVAITNPLVKQAAISYLQPKMSTPDIRSGEGWRWTPQFTELFVCIHCCCGDDEDEEEEEEEKRDFGYINGIVFGLLRWILGICSNSRGERRDHEE